MELRKLGIERYKGYTQRAEVQLAPLTILVGSNNSGKTALAQAIQLLAGGLISSEPEASEPLPLDSGGIRHGETFEDLVTGRPVHGQLRMSAALVDDTGETSLSATIRNVVTPDKLPGPIRPMIVETHSEMMLLRARRWIAEGRLPAEDVHVYWIHAEPGSGSVPRKITINERGEMDSWPDGVFIEDYEEILAIRRAARTRG